jgi:N-acetylglucosaminyldiphosphoundecaprenol N-acetyl-beta-D-mannosaminyltransferase
MKIDARTVSVFDVGLHALRMGEVLDIVETAIRKREQLQIGVVNAAKLVNMRRDQTLFDDVTSSDMVLADGMAVVWASRILGDALPERVAGIDLMMGMLERANKQGYRIFLLGATEEVSAGVAARMAKDFPNAVLAGRHDGYFKEPDEERVVEQIATSRPDILLVAMTSPKKEKFMARWSERMGVPVCHGVGGSFDVYSGKVSRAPKFMQATGLEWLYRVMQEPRRMWKRYLVTNTLFMTTLVKYFFRRRAVPAR